MRIRLLGVRGSLPSPLSTAEYREKVADIIKIYRQRSDESSSIDIDSFIRSLPGHLRNVAGGNTTCVEFISDSGTQYILDAGTGIRILGDELMAKSAGKGQAEVNILFTHTHWDHIHGLPFFKPIYIPGNKINFYSALDDLEERLRYQTDFRFFPAPFEQTASSKAFTKIDVNEIIRLEEDLTVQILPLKHPGGCVAYRFENRRGVFVFATDVEFTGDYLENIDTDSDFFKNADLVVLDSQYTLDESFQKFDWGHTSYTMAVNCGIKWNAKHMVLTHHEPAYSDETLYENFKAAMRHRRELAKKLPHLHLAREGARFRI